MQGGGFLPPCIMTGKESRGIYEKNSQIIFWNMEEIVAGIAMAATLVITTANVLCRYIINTTIAGYGDLVVLGFSWSVFIGISACYKRGMHYGVDILMVILPKKLKPVLSIFIHLILIVGCGIATYLAYQLLIGTLTGTGRVSSYLQIPYAWMYVPSVIGFALMTLHTIRFIIDDIKTMRGIETDISDPYEKNKEGEAVL